MTLASLGALRECRIFPLVQCGQLTIVVVKQLRLFFANTRYVVQICLYLCKRHAGEIRCFRGRLFLFRRQLLSLIFDNVQCRSLMRSEQGFIRLVQKRTVKTLAPLLSILASNSIWFAPPGKVRL